MADETNVHRNYIGEGFYNTFLKQSEEDQIAIINNQLVWTYMRLYDMQLGHKIILSFYVLASFQFVSYVIVCYIGLIECYFVMNKYMPNVCNDRYSIQVKNYIVRCLKQIECGIVHGIHTCGDRMIEIVVDPVNIVGVVYTYSASISSNIVGCILLFLAGYNYLKWNVPKFIITI